MQLYKTDPMMCHKLDTIIVKLLKTLYNEREE